MRRDAVLRIRFITGFVIVLGFILIGRLYQIQILHGASYREEAEKQYVHTVQDLYKRGSIYLTTKDGELVSAATIKSGFLLVIDPTRITNIESTYVALSEQISLERELFFERAGRTDRTYQELDRQVSAEAAAKIQSLNLPGVKLYRNQWRFYPGNDLAARSVGFIGYDGDVLRGRYGLERYYDDVLFRERERLSINFFAEIFSNLGDLVFENKVERAGNIVTTIEPTVARTLDRVLVSAQERWQSAHTGGIIVDPTTGAIYALNVVPSFNLNDRAGVPIEDFQNPLVESVYELGSIIKPLTVAAGLDAGVITPDSTYYDQGCVKLNERTLCNYDLRARGTVTIQQILSQSLNTGVAYIADRLGKDRFRSYFYNLKLGSETGIDLPNEAYGLVKNLESTRAVEYATASFGQGIALTPIAAVRALSTLANGGVLTTPHLASHIEYEDGKSHEIGFLPGERVFSERATEDTTRILVEVVDTALKQGKAKMEHYTIAAKTGTAQIADPVNGGYYKDRFLHSFFGYFPAYEPKFLIFLYTIEPKGVQYASETLTDPFIELTQFLINYYELPPDR